MKKKKRSFLQYTSKTPGAKNYQVDHDGVIMRRICRGLSIPVAQALSKTKITPNMITFLSFALTIPAFILFLRGEYIYTVIAGSFALLSYFADYLDGSLARIKKMGSVYGHWLDTNFGRMGIITLFLGITIGVYIQERTPFVWLFGFLAISAALSIGAMYNSLHRLAPNAHDVIKKEKRKLGFMKNFFFTEVFYYPFIFIMSIFDKLYAFLIFSSIYGWIFFFGAFYKLSKWLKKQVKKTKI